MLAEETLYRLLGRLFLAGEKKSIDPSSYWKEFWSSEETDKLVSGSVYSSSHLEAIINKGKRGRGDFPSSASILYLAFASARTLALSNIKASSLPLYLIPADLIRNYDYYHTRDFFDLLWHFMAEKEKRESKRRKGINVLEEINGLSPILKLSNVFSFLFPLKGLEPLKFEYDQTLKSTFCITGLGFPLLYLPSAKSLADDYVKYRYIKGQRAVVFLPEELNTPIRSSATIIVLGETISKIVFPGESPIDIVIPKKAFSFHLGER